MAGLVKQRQSRTGEPIGYAELHCLSHYSFLRAASAPHELVETAAALGYEALALSYGDFWCMEAG